MPQCLTCDTLFDGRTRRKYCSPECYHKSLKGSAHAKGHSQIPWNKGLKGYRNNGSFKKGFIPWNKGKEFSEESRRKMSESKKALVARGWKPWNLGFGDYIAGDKNPRWKGGTNGYRGPNWETQRQKALERDGYTCQDCGGTEDEISGKLEVHHIIPFERYGIENYLEANRLENLITFCTSCHMKEEVATGERGLACD